MMAEFFTQKPTTASHVSGNSRTTWRITHRLTTPRFESITCIVVAMIAYVILLFPSRAPAANFSDTKIGYSISLPGSWRRQMRNDSTHSFYDSSAVHGSQIFVVRRTRDLTLFPTPDSWTRAHFVAYKIAIDYSGYPYSGTVLYFDSSAHRKVNNLWAPEIYATFLLADTLNRTNPPVAAWSDFTKIMAAGNFGYEVYAVGDTSDMLRNVGYYDSLMMTTVLTPPTITARINGGTKTTRTSPAAPTGTRFTYDLLGRAIDVKRKSAGVSTHGLGVSRTSLRVSGCD